MSTWIKVCPLADIEQEGVRRFDHSGKTYAIYRSPEGDIFCTDGLCTHEEVHLADGMVFGHEIECPKHAGLFDYRTGEAKGLPACVNLQSYPARVAGEIIEIEIA